MANIKSDELQSVIERANQTELSFPFVPVSEQIHALRMYAFASWDRRSLDCTGMHRTSRCSNCDYIFHCAQKRILWRWGLS